MAHCIHKCTNTLYDYAIINYVSLIYELKKNGKVFTSKFVGTAVSQRLRNTGLKEALSPPLRRGIQENKEKYEYSGCPAWVSN